MCSWQCGGCGKWYSFAVQSCDCSKYLHIETSTGGSAPRRKMRSTALQAVAGTVGGNKFFSGGYMFAEFDKVVRSLALELPESVWDDVDAKYRSLKAEVEKFTSTNTGSPKCPLCGSNSVETRTVRVCFNRSCNYIEASPPLRAGA